MLGSTAARSRSSRRGTVAAGVSLGVAAAAGALVVGALVAGAAGGGESPAGVTIPTVPITAVAQPTTTTPSTFTSGADASNAALSVIEAYAQQAVGVAVTDPACSRPATGAVGEQFACYATKPGPAFVLLRVTIGENRALTMAVEVNQPSPGEGAEAVPTTAGA